VKCSSARTNLFHDLRLFTGAEGGRGVWSGPGRWAEC